MPWHIRDLSIIAHCLHISCIVFVVTCLWKSITLYLKEFLQTHTPAILNQSNGFALGDGLLHDTTSQTRKVHGRRTRRRAIQDFKPPRQLSLSSTAYRQISRQNQDSI